MHVADADVKRFQDILDEWLLHGQSLQERYPSWLTSILSCSLSSVWKKLGGNQRADFSELLLHDQKYARHLDEQWQVELLSTFFGNRSFISVKPVHEQIYESYYQNARLPNDVRAKLGGSLAMKRGMFSGRTPEEIHQYFNKCSEATYKRDSKKLMSRFFSQTMNLETHIKLLTATYVEKNSGAFFDNYWENLLELFLNQERTLEFVNVLSFWFDKSFDVFSGKPYLPHLFFLYLPEFFDIAKNERRYKQRIQSVKNQAAQKSWYKYLAPYIEKKSFLGR